MLNRKLILFYLSTLQVSLIYAQSINSIINSKTEVKTKCSKLEAIAQRFTGTNLDSALYVVGIMDSLSETTNDFQLRSDTKWFYSIMLVSKPDEALKVAYENFNFCNKSGDCKLITNSYLLLARINWFIRNDQKVFQFYDEALKYAEKCMDKDILIRTYSFGQEFYFNTQQFQKNKSILFKMTKVDPSLINDVSHNADLGDIYRATNNLDSADYYYIKAIKISETKSDKLETMQLYYNYSLIPRARGNTKIAIEYCNKGLLIAEKYEDIKAIINGNKQLFDTYNEVGDILNAKKHLLIVIKKNEERNCLSCLIGDYRRLSEINYSLNNYNEAYLFLLKSIELFQGRNNTQSSANIVKVEEDNLKKQKKLEIDLINQQKETEKRVKNISFIALGISFILILGIVFSLVQIYKSKKIIIIQKLETEKQKHLIEEKQNEVLSSIRYAKRIQNALLPQEKYIARKLNELNK